MQWYTRRDGVIRGPFAADEITRYLILGRIRMDDELSQDRFTWATANRCTELLPDELQKLSSWDDYQQLVITRMQVDERKAKDAASNAATIPAVITSGARMQIDAARITTPGQSISVCQPDSSCKPHHTREKLRPLLLTVLLATMVFAWLVPSQR